MPLALLELAANVWRRMAWPQRCGHARPSGCPTTRPVPAMPPCRAVPAIARWACCGWRGGREGAAPGQRRACCRGGVRLRIYAGLPESGTSVQSSARNRRGPGRPLASAIRVNGPATPSVGRPRAFWKLRTASRRVVS